MRRVMTVTALIAAAGLMTACGGSSGDGDDKGSAGSSTAASSSEASSEGEDKTYEVTLEVGGEGKSSVYYTLGTNGTEQVTLPWKKSGEMTLNPTERKVGIIVSVVPGPVKLSNGQLGAAPCSITVDGKKVVEDQGGVEGAHKCEYTLN
ncbi:hypothetical protein GCM10010261_66020 [Streptomyces pilosus]|uniref:MmpS family membrane protein n=2 Tax=Streptomyces pilosus TaxID=28893 RepID=A0A918F6X0_9ACTN|nr:hypothetical protein GCM10010280_63510 [Streptomyces pilosus]GGV70613.1 hypothetical protein GCM10010261_66020 [Streptomyces pilosus]